MFTNTDSGTDSGDIVEGGESGGKVNGDINTLCRARGVFFWWYFFGVFFCVLTLSFPFFYFFS